MSMPPASPAPGPVIEPAPVPVLHPPVPASEQPIVSISGRAAKRAREAEARALATLVSVHGKADWAFSLRAPDGTVLWEGTAPSVCLVARRERLADIDPAAVELRLQSDVAIVNATHATVHAQRIGKLCQAGGTVLVQNQIGAS